MAEAFTKLEARIIGSTIWTEDDHTRLLWITLLAMADRDGYVGASIPGLANLARIPLESCERAMKKFMEPDKYSRSRDFEGRRVEEADRGFLLLNYKKIRDSRDDEARREYERDRKRKQRDKSQLSPDVPDSPEMSAQAEAEAELDRKSKALVPDGTVKRAPKKSAKELVEELTVDDDLRAYGRKFGVDADSLHEDWRDHFRGNGYKTGKNPVADARATFRRWLREAASRSSRLPFSAGKKKHVPAPGSEEFA